MIEHGRTGLAIAAHIGKHTLAVTGEIDILHGEEDHPSPWIWVHARNLESQMLAALEG